MAWLPVKGGDELKAAMTYGALTGLGLDKLEYNLIEEEEGRKDPLARDKAKRELVTQLKNIVTNEYPVLLENGKSHHMDTYIPQIRWIKLPISEKARIAEKTTKTYIRAHEEAFDIQFPKVYKDAARELRAAALKKNIE